MKSLIIESSSTLRLRNGLNPNSTSNACKNSTGESWVWLMWASAMSFGSSERNASISVVLPEPISPVMTTNPSASQIVDSMYAFARACCLLANRNCGSGVRRNGGSVS
jgi:hypothetical protein